MKDVNALTIGAASNAIATPISPYTSKLRAEVVLPGSPPEVRNINAAKIITIVAAPPTIYVVQVTALLMSVNIQVIASVPAVVCAKTINGADRANNDNIPNSFLIFDNLYNSIVFNFLGRPFYVIYPILLWIGLDKDFSRNLCIEP